MTKYAIELTHEDNRVRYLKNSENGLFPHTIALYDTKEECDRILTYMDKALWKSVWKVRDISIKEVVLTFKDA